MKIFRTSLASILIVCFTLSPLSANEIRWSTAYDFTAHTAITKNLSGDLYVAGMVWQAGEFYVAVTKYDGAGNELWRELLFRTGREFRVNDVAVDGTGGVLLAGITGNNALPATPGALATERPGANSGFVLKWDEQSRRVAWATYIGGSLQSNGSVALTAVNDIELGDDGTVYGIAVTNTRDFPAHPEEEAISPRGYTDDVAFSLAADGSALLWARYIGGSGIEGSVLSDWALLAEPKAQDLVLDTSGHPIIGGVTASLDFPVTPDAFQSGFAGGADLYVAKLDKATGTPIWSTYLGGSGLEQGVRLAVDDADGVYAAAATDSVDFPTTDGVFQQANPWSSGGTLAVVAALTGDGDLNWSTYLASESPACTGAPACGAMLPFGISAQGEAIAVAGRVDGNALPIAGDPSIDGVNQGGSDVFVAELNGDGSALNYSGYLGGSASDYATAVAQGRGGELYLIGQTGSPDFPLTVEAQPSEISGFVTLLAESDSLRALPKIQVNGAPGPLVVEVGEQITVDISLLPRDDLDLPADWWVAANTAFGWFSYSDALQQWVHVGVSHLNLVPTFEQPVQLLPPQRIMTTTGLGAGRYGLYLGVDFLPNGVLDMDSLAYTRAVVEIVE
jgi:hypothetical protein